MAETSQESATADLAIAVGRTAHRLQEEILGARGDRAQAIAQGTLASLRRSAAFTPEQDPLAFQRVLSTLRPGLHEADLGSSETASATERAAFHALTHFALHMQSQSSGMHVSGRSFATAAGLLIRGVESSSIRPRFNALLAARSESARLTHLRSLVTLLRSSHLGFDYGWLAQDLRALTGARRNNVLLRWGRDVVVGPARDDSKATLPAQPTA